MTVVAPPAALDRALALVGDELERWQTPGLEVAAVLAGEPVFCGGLGVRGVDDPTPVTSTTLFHHGSCGKAYTGLVAAVLAHEGVVDLDAPVRLLVPELRLPDPVIAERVTIRDLVSHRSGLGRHDFAWILNSSWSREELVRRLEHLPLAGDLRTQLVYSNFGFALAGLALERAAGRNWPELLHARVLAPLGMHRTFGAAVDPVDDPDHARPHVVRGGAPVVTTPRVMRGIAPAGQILSCADDSVRWLRAQLGFDGGIGPDVVRAAQQPQMLGVADTSPFPEMTFFAYAMGWLVGRYRGHDLVWHNGGVDGFTTQTLLLPQQGIGVLASANQHLTNFPLAVVLQLADAVLGVSDADATWFDRLRPDGAQVPAQDTARPVVASPSHPVADYAGLFRNGGYGDLEVTAEHGALAVRAGEAAVTATHRHYDTWDLHYEPLDADFPVTFATTADGVIEEAVVEFEAGAAPVRFTRVRDEAAR